MVRKNRASRRRCWPSNSQPLPAQRRNVSAAPANEPASQVSRHDLLARKLVSQADHFAVQAVAKLHFPSRKTFADQINLVTHIYRRHNGNATDEGASGNDASSSRAPSTQPRQAVAKQPKAGEKRKRQPLEDFIDDTWNQERRRSRLLQLARVVSYQLRGGSRSMS